MRRSDPHCSRRSRSARPARRTWREGGYATAETAVALPALVLLAAMLVWGVLAAAAQIRCVDAARVGARAAARGEEDTAVLAAVRRAAPVGAEVRLVRGAETVRVAVTASFGGPGGLAGVLSVRTAADAVAAREDLPPQAPPVADGGAP
ncbi:TadE family type IV pilus minor pilin [Streptacidiphilus sp. ASG 303]|uniref:TadE family type IV pilus minor pilin n=1 Tax=Streptacidiphilus sp. ASG 303 TaxID=2896847 RepID=UPI00272D6DA6|nr:TadE family type IV pilus minor pilin [Streptacidiphilus sp. ASG 303]